MAIFARPSATYSSSSTGNKEASAASSTAGLTVSTTGEIESSTTLYWSIFKTPHMVLENRNNEVNPGCTM